MGSRLSFAPPPLFLVTSPDDADARVITVVREAVAGGVTHVVLRRPTATAREVFKLAVILGSILAKTSAELLVSDRLDVALEMDDAGAHLGRRSLSPATARRITPGRLLGASVSSPGAAIDSANAGVDYMTFGNVFETKTHPGLPGRGVELLRDVVKAVDVPVIAIGGVTADRVGELIDVGATGVAVIRAIGEAADPRHAAQELRDALDDAYRRKQ